MRQCKGSTGPIVVIPGRLSCFRCHWQQRACSAASLLTGKLGLQSRQTTTDYQDTPSRLGVIDHKPRARRVRAPYYPARPGRIGCILALAVRQGWRVGPPRSAKRGPVLLPSKSALPYIVHRRVMDVLQGLDSDAVMRERALAQHVGARDRES